MNASADRPLSSPLHAALAERAEWTADAVTEPQLQNYVALAAAELDVEPSTAERVVETQNTVIYQILVGERRLALKIARHKSAALLAEEFRRLQELTACGVAVPEPILLLQGHPAYVLGWVDGEACDAPRYFAHMTTLAGLAWDAAEASSTAPLAELSRSAAETSPLGPGFRVLLNRACKLLDRSTSPAVTCHGDLHVDNIVVPATGSVVMIDPRPHVSTMPLDWDLATSVVSHRLTLGSLAHLPSRRFAEPDFPAERARVFAALQVLRLAELQILWRQDAEITGSVTSHVRARLGDVLGRVLAKEFTRNVGNG